jgi:hypothetical protein
MTPGAGMITPPGSGMTPGTGMTPGSGMTPGAGMTTPPGSGMIPGSDMNDRRVVPYFYGVNPEVPRSSTPQEGIPSVTPNMIYPPYQGIPNMYLPNVTPYQTPMGIPMFPLYGYDNSADLDRDVEYMKQLYPNTAKRILREVDDECDKMEYDGSMMFDEYPDREYLEKITDRIYAKIRDMDDEPEVEANSVYFYPPRRRRNNLRDIVSLILLNELLNRRRRYRSRRRWF